MLTIHGLSDFHRKITVNVRTPSTDSLMCSQIGMATFRKSEIWVFHTNLQPFTCLIFHVSQYRERENLKPFEIVMISQKGND